MEAIGQAGAAVGIRTQTGVIIAAERKILSKVSYCS
jgi:20S proteasome alpha/beta subunit